MIKLKNQIHFCDIYEEVVDCFEEDKPKFIKLFEEHINLEILIPHSFFNAYHSSTGHPRYYSLSSMLTALILQKILGLSETKTFLNILNLSSELRTLCRFFKVPHESQFSRFKNDFINHFHNFFNHLVHITEPICQQLNSTLSKIIIADTTGIEAYVKENNPKFFESLLRVGKSMKKKIDSNVIPHKYAYSKMPKETYANSEIKLSYINGHFCYALKATTLVNGLGIIRHIDFNDTQIMDFQNNNTAEDAKDHYDSKTLIPIMKRFLNQHKDFKYNYFLGDSAYDCDDNYKYLIKDCSIAPIICLNPRNSSNLPQPSGFTSDGTPLCPKDPELPMKFDGITREKGRSMRVKWLCPKSKKIKVNGKTKYNLTCTNPCTPSPCGRIYHPTINKDYRLNCPIPRDSEEWNNLYKIRTVTERTNNTLKNPLGLSTLKINKSDSLKAELFIAGITQLISLIISFKIDSKNNVFSIKSLIAEFKFFK
ncbi:transposase [Clostridium pasteurianum]|uniref:Transposase family protein n=1 Tax=Clostridium pasteurianum BC1 TaxID=86416 RepID=R4KD26_CLOPA|nr:transposase [Clostridium pasteurianum]AGK98449.1 transposase family protein [Clostridium pasteurianum BC1]